MSDGMLARLQALAAAAPAMQAQRAKDQEHLVAQLRFMMPGFTGRLEGNRLVVTAEEYAMLRERIATVARDVSDPAGFALLDVVLEQPEPPELVP